jgi:alpha-L-rhamnosidase
VFVSSLVVTSGDWWSPIGGGARHTSNVINGFFWIRQLTIVQAAAARQNMSADATKFADMLTTAKAGFVKKYYDTASGTFVDPTRRTIDGPVVVQTEQSLGLILDLLPTKETSRVVDALVKDVLITQKGHLSTGMVGIKYLLTALTMHGRTDVAMAIMTQTDCPSFGNMLLHGEMTLWEHFAGSEHDPHAPAITSCWEALGSGFTRGLLGCRLPRTVSASTASTFALPRPALLLRESSPPVVQQHPSPWLPSAEWKHRSAPSEALCK